MNSEDHELTPEQRSEALRAAVQAGLLTACPRHPDVLLSMGVDEKRSDGVPASMRNHVDEVIGSMPSYCPKCADADD